MLLAFGLGRWFGGVLFQVSSTDPVTFTLAPAILVASALLASWLPARRGSQTRPLS